MNSVQRAILARTCVNAQEVPSAIAHRASVRLTRD